MALGADRTVAVGERLRPADGLGLPNTQETIPASADVAVVGAGVIGLSIAWRLAERGLSVAVFDRGTAGTGTSFAATGMLAAGAEHEPGGETLLPLALESQRLWPLFRQELESISNIPIDYRDEGTLLVALNRDEVARLRFRHEHQRKSGIGSRWLNGSEVRAREPGLRASIAGGILCASDHQIDPRRLIPALTAALHARGGMLVQNCSVTALEMSGGRVTGVVTPAGLCLAKTVIAASGVWVADGLLPAGIDIPLRPVKGQALALRTTARTGALSHIVWTEQVHLAPKSDGRLIVGSTMEDTGFNPAITAGGMLALLDGVHHALPSSEEMEIEAIWSGFRPTTEDDAPVLGETGVPGLLVATGHHRNGILLAPVTAAIIAELITSGNLPSIARPFGLDRFQNAAAKQPLAMGV